MNGRRIDVAIAGGGLAGGLIALALRRLRPELSVGLFEAGPVLGGNHRWSWFDCDLDAEGRALLAPFRTTAWSGYDVRFPANRRTLSSRYNSLASADFDAALRRELGQDTIHTDRFVASMDVRGLDLSNGERIEARIVIDCRDGFDTAMLRGGWQVFMGRHVRTHSPHGIERPIIMDATVEQHGSYRFVYTLPLGAHDLFVEDTYYADSPVLDRGVLSGRIDRYCEAHGWRGDPVAFETGVLPVVTGGDFAAYQRAHRIDGVAVAGARGGFWHPLTSYTLPFAAQTALAIAREADLPGVQLAAMVEARAAAHWRDTRFYRALGRMLFDAEPDERYRIFQHFYRLPEPLVERFYAIRSTPFDRFRVLCGKPPMPIPRALAALAGQNAPLTRVAS